MDMNQSSVSDAALVDVKNGKRHDVLSSQSVFPFLKLPRELRDQVYNHAYNIQDDRSERALRIERRNLKYFRPSAAAILLVLHHEYFLLNRQVAREALEVLLKNHTVFLSCGPFVLKSLLEKIEQQNGPGRQWLKWMKKIELDWVTFPNLKLYPPDREGRDEWYWEHDEAEVDVDCVRGAQYNGHYDEYDHEGGHYEDNFYEPSNSSLYPSFHQPAAAQSASSNDPFGFANHYPFTDPSQDHAEETSAEDIATKLDLLISMEVSPLFSYLASPIFNLTSITIPLYFISKQSHHHRSVTRPGYALPLKIRYWTQVCIHALLMLLSPSSSSNTCATSATSSMTYLPTLQEVRIKYLPWDIWASMDPADDLHRMNDKGIWFDTPEDGEGGEREGEGEAFRAVWAGVRAKLGNESKRRMGLVASVTFVPWDGNVDSWRVGDELEVVLTGAEGN
ncbi:Nn.00g055130.m01.CDS01 [Neocucurbitaria sp. VM-36]